MLASDANNPEFMGAHNPDEKLFVEFYMREPEDQNKSMEAGKMVRGPSTPYVRIQVPGDKTSVIETPVREDHKARWPQKWLYFQMRAGLIGSDAVVPGWPIDEWDYLTDEQKRELKYMRFSVVEQLAGASDDQCQRIGMAGMSLREEAKKAIKERYNRELREAEERREREIAELRVQADKEKQEMQKQLDELRQMVMQQAQTPATSLSGEAPKRKPGRPKKVQPQEQVNG